jgi:hypothetical protein
VLGCVLPLGYQLVQRSNEKGRQPALGHGSKGSKGLGLVPVCLEQCSEPEQRWAWHLMSCEAFRLKFQQEYVALILALCAVSGVESVMWA